MPQRQHRRLVKYLVVIASVLTVFAIFSVWVQRQLLSTNEWVNTSGRLLENQHIQEALGSYAVDEFYGAVNVDRELQAALPRQFKQLSGPAATGLQQLAQDAVPKILATSRFQTLWEDANRTAHEELVAIVEGKSDVIKNTNGEVILNVRPLVVQVADSLGIGGGLAGNIPPDVGHLRILKSSDLGLAQDIAAGIRGLAIVLSILVFLLYGLAVYFSRGYRWVTLLAVGGGLAAAGVVALILREVVGTIVVSQLAADSAKDAANAAWSIGTSLMVSIATTVIVYGVVFMVSGWLGSPARSARSARRFLTPILRDQMPALIGVFVTISLIFLLLGLGDTRAVLTRLFLIGFGAFGLVYLRRHSMAEFPQAEMPDVSDSFRDGMESVRGWFGRRAPSAEEPEDMKLERLERLAALHERGALSDEEFKAEKAALLGSGAGSD